MHFLSRSKFEFTGEFSGFVHNRAGKRRMLLQVNATDSIALKLPKSLRNEFKSRLVPGIRVAVFGIESRDIDGRSKYVVSHLRLLTSPLPPTPEACATCTIRICAKKKCWMNGGAKIFSQLQNRVSELGLLDVVKVKAVGCLDNCKHGPNLECGKKLHERCESSAVDEIVERAKQRVNR